jgi:acetyltransferase-like isoleucine patch superfamily enzyme
MALKTCRECGTEAAIVMQASQYVELDVAELFQFHRASGQMATPVRDSSGPLGTTIVGNHSTEHSSRVGRQATESTSGDYIHRGYANRLSTPHDLRRLAQDALHQRCTIQPNGMEVRPGVWMSPSARLHKRTRVIAPAYIGAHTRLRAGVVVASGTNIEHHCEVDHGTVVENTTILPHTYLGSSLDIAHSIVSRNIIVDVRRAVEVEIGDDSFIGSTSPVSRPAAVPPVARSLPVIGLSRWKKLSAAFAALFFDPLVSLALVQHSFGASERQTGLTEVPGSGHSRTVGG